MGGGRAAVVKGARQRMAVPDREANVGSAMRSRGDGEHGQRRHWLRSVRGAMVRPLRVRPTATRATPVGAARLVRMHMNGTGIIVADRARERVGSGRTVILFSLLRAQRQRPFSVPYAVKKKLNPLKITKMRPANRYRFCCLH
jgi:hypothetical protein